MGTESGDALLHAANDAYLQSRNEESRAFFEDALRRYRVDGNRVGEANAILGLGNIERMLGRANEARKAYDESLRHFKAEHDRLGEADVLRNLGHLEHVLGRNEEARKLFADARRLYQILSHRLGEARVLVGLGELERTLGRNDAARDAYLEAQSGFRAVADRLGEATVFRGLGDLAQTLGRSEDARIAYLDAQRNFHLVENRLGEASVLAGLGDVEGSLGRYDEARKAYNTARSLFRAVQNPLGEAYVLLGLGDLECALDRSSEARQAYEGALTLFKAEEDPLGEAGAHEALGHLDRLVGRWAEARKQFRDAAIYYGLAGRPDEQRKSAALAQRTPVLDRLRFVFGWMSKRKTFSLLAVGLVVLPAMFLLLQSGHAPDRTINQFTVAGEPYSGGRWFKFGVNSATTVVFVHGILSNPSAFRFDDRTTWPQLLHEDPRSGKPNVYLAQYYTSPQSGVFDIPAATEEMKTQLNLAPADGNPAPLQSESIVFIAHSTGGLVVRDLLTRYPELFKGKKVGLALVASPSRGSAWANRLGMAIDVANNRMAGQLQKGNEWTDDLDKRFAEFVHKSDDVRGFSIKGIDLFENRFVVGNYPVLRYLIPTRTVVVSERDSASYFGAGKIVPDTDHFTIAKPSSLDHASHRYLMEWWVRCGW